MPRAIFEKTGNAVYISHLDLMRLFQRAFKRAGLLLTHTQGFNPRPSVSIALPLSVGVESFCELLDFDLEGEKVSCEEICQRLNDALVEGVRVKAVYDDGAKLKHLELLDCVVALEYDSGIPAGALDSVKALFERPSLVLEKKGKNGITQQDIIPMIKALQAETPDEKTIALRCRICCQNPTLNPAQIAAAVSVYLPEFAPDHSRCKRLEIFNENGTCFR